MGYLKRLILGFYGDDFTGSTDAMEALDQYGLKTILFLKIPNEKMMERFQDVDCVGVAGTARAKNKNGMEKELVPVYDFFQKINPYFVHYKVCSTFDSSPDVGSIGFAGDLARNYFNKGSFPLLVAAPMLGRYTVFGNHFAAFQDKVYRLDRHPVMSRHPVTPMDEADLAVHLQKQTEQQIDKVSILDLEEQNVSEIIEKHAEEDNIVLFDALNDVHMEKVSQILWKMKGTDTQFLLGSSGIEYALGDAMKRNQAASRTGKDIVYSKIEKIFSVSGSVSEVTKQQLENAEKAGFHLEQIPYELFTDEEKAEEFLENIVKKIERKKKVIIYTAKGPDDPIIEKTKQHLRKEGISKEDRGIYIGKRLGEWTKKVLDQIEIKRLIISGGDTSGFVTSNLDIFGLEVLDSIAPGAPLCLAYSERPKFDGLEIALKSGQLGGPQFFEKVYHSGS
ncbi:four-carbon acid sugar kinase family protein [Oceanobacillus neutriphilus]|uniref:four-carbon acid sugar kinase family protein n=1 Tax=Oceanobacillus neutriphilus TaxID=531815 RepID=UPI001E3D8929|nr:four-carbon acid sugar kinase family protein [Oceanobacillus neutriphilus]